MRYIVMKLLFNVLFIILINLIYLNGFINAYIKIFSELVQKPDSLTNSGISSIIYSTIFELN